MRGVPALNLGTKGLQVNAADNFWGAAVLKGRAPAAITFLPTAQNCAWQSGKSRYHVLKASFGERCSLRSPSQHRPSAWALWHTWHA